MTLTTDKSLLATIRSLFTLVAFITSGIWLGCLPSNSAAQDLDLDLEFVSYSPIVGTPFEELIRGSWTVVSSTNPADSILGDQWTIEGATVRVDRHGKWVRSYELSAELGDGALRIGLMNTSGRQYVFHHGALIRIGGYLVICYSQRGGPLFLKEKNDIDAVILRRSK